MKCIKAIVGNNNYQAGQITRVENKEADLKVSTGLWSYVPKSEWKSDSRHVTSEVSSEETPKKKKTKKQK